MFDGPSHVFPIFVVGNDDFSSSSSYLGVETWKRFRNTGEITAFHKQIFEPLQRKGKQTLPSLNAKFIVPDCPISGNQREVLKIATDHDRS